MAESSKWGCGCPTFEQWWEWLIKENTVEARFMPGWDLGATSLMFRGTPFRFCPFCGKPQFPVAGDDDE